jgi:regulator of sirC expression with transglutaminase-like and TPR domain
MPGIRDRFAALVGPDHPVDLARAALEIARIAYPQLEPDPWLQSLDDLAAAARRHLPEGNLEQRATALARFLFEDCGFRGNQDDYYDPRNSFLNDVLTRRVGIPISLAVVMMEVGRRVGVPLEGVGFPGHFLVRVPSTGEPILLDPFHGGTRLRSDDLLARLHSLAQSSGRGGPRFAEVPTEFVEPTSLRAILARMLRNLLRIYQDRDEHLPALHAVDLLLVLTPRSPEDIRIRGSLYEALECPAAAADDFRRYLEIAPDADDADDVRTRLSRLADQEPTLH